MTDQNKIDVTFTVKASIVNFEHEGDGAYWMQANGNSYTSLRDLVWHELQRDLQNIKIKDVTLVETATLAEEELRKAIKEDIDESFDLDDDFDCFEPPTI